MRVTKTPTTKRDGRNLRRERQRWDDADRNSMPLGCVNCTDREICGGIHKKQADFWCLSDCCGNAASCDNVCPNNLDQYVDRIREVNSFELTNIPRSIPRLSPDVPEYVPMLFHGNRRSKVLEIPFVALPLHQFYSRRDGTPIFSSRAEVERAFRIGKDTRIILVGSGRDKPIEAWWGLSERRRNVISALQKLGVVFVTSPNYSVFTDVPRHDNLYNLKRIGIAWQEFVSGGIASSLHLNGRTEYDYKRLMDFARERDEVSEVSFEFRTGGSWRGRRAFHHQQLAEFAKNVGKPIRLTMIGGAAAIPILAVAYSKLIYVDTTPFMKAMHRQRLILGNENNVVGIPERTKPGEPLNDLLAHNIKVAQTRIQRLISEARQSAAEHSNAPRRENPEKDSSVRAERSGSRDANR